MFLKYIGAMLLVAQSFCFAADVDQPAPALEAKLLDGTAFSTKSAKGQVIIVNFWATWCDACRTEMPALEAFYKKHRQEGLRLIALSMDDDKDVPKVREVMKAFTFNGGLAKEAQYKSYGRIWRLPLTFVIDRQGILRQDGWAPDKPLASDDLEKTITPLLKK